MKYHPDKNPNAGEKFKEISMAYEAGLEKTRVKKNPAQWVFGFFFGFYKNIFAQ